MASLSAHLCRPDEHGRLGFHPGCPICRGERLAGSLRVDPLVSRRAQAALTAGVLAVTSVAPSAAFAADDEVIEGTAPETQTADFDPGGESSALDEDTAMTTEDVPVASAPGGSVPKPVQNAAGVDPSRGAPAAAPVQTGASADQAEDVAAEAEPEAGDEVAPADSAPDVPAAETESASTAPSGAKPEPDAARSAPSAIEPHWRSARTRNRNTSRHARLVAAAKPRTGVKVRVSTQVVPAHPPAAASQVAAPGAAAPAAPAPRVAAATAAAPRTAVHVKAVRATARPGDDWHVVQRGESLWSIASATVGDGASPARIAREVNRLWELNKARIGTGNRDLLMAGTRLEL